MATDNIPFDKYIDITSGVGAATAFSTRSLSTRKITTNSLIPTKGLVKFTSLSAVGDYFGTTSEEYRQAAPYFGFISKDISAPDQISFWRWADVATAPLIWGAKNNATTLAAFQAITNGVFTLTLGAQTLVVNNINLSTATTLADVASLIQARVRAVFTTWTSLTVTYDATRTAFNLNGVTTGNAAIAVSNTGTGTLLAPLIGWTAGAILSNGVAAETPVEAMTLCDQTDNGFGMFEFIAPLTMQQAVDVATWNQALNVKYAFQVTCLRADVSAYSAALIGIGGCFVTERDPLGGYNQTIPEAALASIRWERPNSVINFMYQDGTGYNATVTNGPDSDLLDGLRINYVGVTQQAGQQRRFYQRGTMMGPATSPTNLTVYVNEMWLKDRAAVDLMNLQLALNQIPANDSGRALVTAALEQGVIPAALNNGAISVNKPLSTTQKLYIGQITADPTAWRQVQDKGYWLGVAVQAFQPSVGVTEYKMVYTLVYSKDDVINKIEGTHVLI